MCLAMVLNLASTWGKHFGNVFESHPYMGESILAVVPSSLCFGSIYFEGLKNAFLDGFIKGLPGGSRRGKRRVV